MSKYDLTGVHVLNKFIWGQLKVHQDMNEANYNGIVPIIPTQQVPALNNLSAGKPFIVYTYVTSGYRPDIWSNIEQVTYRVFGDNEGQIRRVTNFLIDLLKRYEWTADEVNSWIDRGGFPLDTDDGKFDFKYVTVVGSSSPEPSNQEGGRQFSSVTVRLAYVHNETSTFGQHKGMRN